MAYGTVNVPGSSSDGKTVTSAEVTYQSSISGTSIPTGTWSTSIPSVPIGYYLWTKTIFNYSDGTNTTAYSVARNGADGSDAEITVDSALSATSTNPVQNKVVASKLAEIQNNIVKIHVSATEPVMEVGDLWFRIAP